MASSRAFLSATAYFRLCAMSAFLCERPGARLARDVPNASFWRNQLCVRVSRAAVCRAGERAIVNRVASERRCEDRPLQFKVTPDTRSLERSGRDQRRLDVIDHQDRFDRAGASDELPVALELQVLRAIAHP